MKTHYRLLAREQLEETLARLAPLKAISSPKKGWVHAIRNALGMSGRQLAQRLGVSKMRVTDIERAETAGAITLKSLRRAAEALDCTLVYALVPNTRLKDTIHKQAKKKARQDLARASHTMALEDQGLSSREMEKAIETTVDSLVGKMPRTLWD